MRLNILLKIFGVGLKLHAAAYRVSLEKRFAGVVALFYRMTHYCIRLTLYRPRLFQTRP